MIRNILRWLDERRTKELCFVVSGLDSIDPGLSFRMKFHVFWRFSSGAQLHYNPEAVVRSFVRDCAQRSCLRSSIKDFQSVEDKINSSLGRERFLAQGGVRYLRGRGRMDISPDLVGSALELEQRRLKRLELEKEQEDQFRRASSFRHQVLEDPGIALAYWFMNNPHSLNEQAMSDVEKLTEKLAFHGASQSWALISKMVYEFIKDLSVEEKRDSLEVLMIIFKRYERYEMVDRLRSDLGWSAAEDQRFR